MGRGVSWDERLISALKPGRWYARHYSFSDVARALRVPKDTSFYNAVYRAVNTNVIVSEPWGPIAKTLTLPAGERCEKSRQFLESLNYREFVNTPRDAWPTFAEAELELGLKPSGLSAWFRNRDLLVVCPRHGKYRLVPPWLLSYYLEETEREGVDRVDVRPYGYVGIYRAAALIGAHRTVVERAVKRGEVHAVRKGWVNYYCKNDLERLVWSLKNKPLPGYESLRERCERLGADRTACADWLKSHGFDLRKFRMPDKQIGLYALKRDLDTWQARFTGDTRALTLEQAREVRQRRRAGEKRIVLAREFGISDAAVRYIANGVTYKEA